MARRKNPFEVYQLDHTDFVDCKMLCDHLIKNRKKMQKELNWLKIKVFRFEKNSRFVRYKYRYDDDFSTINASGRGRPPVTNLSELTQCYISRLPIAAAKKMDLLSLCKTGVVPNEHHHFAIIKERR